MLLVRTLLAITVVAVVTVVRGRPLALTLSSELGDPRDPRWDSETEDHQLARIAETFRTSERLQRAVLAELQGLTETQLRLLERALGATEDLLDLPQADMPGNTSTAFPHNASDPLTQKMNREKLKEMRLANIKNQIMKTLWPVGTPPSLSGNMTQSTRHDLLRVIAEKMKSHSTFVPEDVYTEKIQSFYPSCEVPRNTDPDLWGSSTAMNLMFDISYPSTLQGTQVNIVAAKLRLYKLLQFQSNMTESVEHAPATESEDVPSEESPARQPFQPTSSFTEDKMIRVSVYWYTRSLKKHRVKRKLLDSQMLSVFKESWTEWNIRGAVKAWRDSGRNFGITVVVEDEDGNLLPTDKYFTPMNCSQGASTSRPIPGFLVARALTPEAGFNSTNQTTGQTLHFDTLLFPMIDLCTMEVPEYDKPDLLYNPKAHRSTGHDEKPIVDFLRKVQNSTVISSTLQYGRKDTEKHKIRHQSQKNVDENHNSPPQRHLETVRRDDGDSIEEITWADDLDGHQLRKQIIVQKTIMKKKSGEIDNDR